MNIRVFTDSVLVRKAVLGFSGWPDAGKLIQFTLDRLKMMTSNQLAANWDLDGFWHTEAVRPQISAQHGQVRRMEWPGYQFFLVNEDFSRGPVLLGEGLEPSLAWRAFARQLVELLKGWGCEQIILLGSMLDQVLHDEIIISCVVQDSSSYNLALEEGCQLIAYEGPSAIHAAVMAEAKQANIGCMSFWGHLPFYLNGPHELIAARLLGILGRMLGMELAAEELVTAWKEREQQIEQIVGQDKGLQQTLESLKQQKVMKKIGPSAKVVRFEDFLKKRSLSDPEQE